MIKESREKNRLLIADDSKMNREILKEILGDEYIVTEAKDGTEAIELLKKGRRFIFSTSIGFKYA